MSWSGWVARWFFPQRSLFIADQVVAQFEDRAWGLVERRIMWLSYRELRGYVRARIRPMLNQIVRETPSALAQIQANPQYIDMLVDRLVTRLIVRAEMARSQSQLRNAA